MARLLTCRFVALTLGVGVASWCGCAPVPAPASPSRAPTSENQHADAATPASASAPSARSVSDPDQSKQDQSKQPVQQLDAAGKQHGNDDLEASTKPAMAEPELPVAFEQAYRFGARPVSEQAIDASLRETEIGMWNSGGGSAPEFVTNRQGYHAAVRVIVNATVLSGRGSLGALSPRDVLANARASGYWPFRLCYEEGLRAGERKRGTVAVRLSANRGGSVTFARSMSSSLSRSVTQCLRQATYKLKFKAGARRRLDLQLTLQLSPGDAALPPRTREPNAPDSAASRAPSRSGDTNPTVPELAAVAFEPAPFEPWTHVVAECYGPGLQRDAQLWGRVQVRLKRDERGAVVSAEQLDSQFPDPEVVACIESRLVGKPLDLPLDFDDIVVAWRLGEALATSQ